MKDERQRLYERFRDRIGYPDDGSEYFDEEDLIEIYDYANDNGDEMTKMEVLFYGARNFPHSEELKTRREYLYYYLGFDDAVKTLLERSDKDTTLKRLLNLRRLGLTDGNQTSAILDSIVEQAGVMNDEEIIQIISEGSLPQNYPWLKKNWRKIKDKSDYLQTMYYELAYAGRDNEDYGFASEMAEELTMLEPFNVEFWLLLGQTQLLNGQYTDAVTSLDYGLALDPESSKLLQTKATALYRLDHSSREAMEMLLPLIDEEDFDTDASLTALVLLLNNRGQREKAVEVLRHLAERKPGNQAIIDSLLAFDSDNAEMYSGLLADETLLKEYSFWQRWADRFVREGVYSAAAVLLKEGLRRNPETAPRVPLLETLYRAKRYEEVLALYPKCSSFEKSTCQPGIVAALTLARLGRKAEGLSIVESMIEEVGINGVVIPEAMDEASEQTRRYYSLGTRIALSSLNNALSSKEDLPIDDYDPLA